MKLYSKDRLINSRIFFDKRPPKFMTFLVYFTLLILVLLFIASSKINKNYIVKANGQISDRNIVYVSSNVNGTIKEKLFEEGSFVNKGDTILIISNGEENIQRKEYEKILEVNKAKKELLEKYRKALDDRENYLMDSGIEQEYFGKVSYYLDAIKSGNQNKDFTNQDIEKKQNKLYEKISERDALSYKINSLEENKEYYNNLLNYYENLNFEILDLENKISEMKLVENHDIEEIKLKEVKLSEMKLEYRNYTNAQENKSKSDSEYETTKSKIESLDSEIEGLRDEISQLERQKTSSHSQANQIYFQFINEIGSELKNIEKSDSEIKMNLSVFGKRDENFEISASKSGYIHYLNSLKEGVNVQVNQTLVEISELKEDYYYVDSYINLNDISKIQVGQEVDVAIVGVNTYKYGTLKGKITSIDNGLFTMQTSEGNNSFYKAIIEIENKSLIKGDEEIPLILSMPVEARIVYDKETYLDYLLEKLSFKE